MPESAAAAAEKRLPVPSDEELKRLPFGARLRLYLAERFPIAAYATLIVTLALACQAVAQASGWSGARLVLSWRSLAAIAVVFLVFFHLRLMDESKDYDEDRVAHPERLVSRGIVTLADLGRVAAAVVALEFGLSGSLAALAPRPFGWLAMGAYLACFAFTILMRAEFFVPALLKKDAFVYALTHHPIIQLLGVFIAYANGARFPLVLIPFLLGTGLNFEISRNTRSPEEDLANPHETTYSKRFGAGGAAALCGALAALALGATIWIGFALRLPVWADIAAAAVTCLPLLAVFRFIAAPTPRAAKKLETACALQALALYGIVTAAVAASRGVAWAWR